VAEKIWEVSEGTDGPASQPVVFIHGLWLHAESWKPWVEYFNKNGYAASAVNWPGDGHNIGATRENPSSVAGYGVDEVADYITGEIAKLPEKPILIGHSFGGLLAQLLLGRGLAVAAIAIDPAPIQGVFVLPLSAIKASLPVLGNPLNFGKAISLTEEQFRFAFANARPHHEAKELWAKHAIPAPARPIFQAATANLNPFAATKVNTANATRGPLLLTAGLEDNTVPPAMVRSAFNLYAKSPAVTELKEFPRRGHSLVIDGGWLDIAEACLHWLQEKKL